jgi:hypothetical protein
LDQAEQVRDASLSWQRRLDCLVWIPIEFVAYALFLDFITGEPKSWIFSRGFLQCAATMIFNTLILWILWKVVTAKTNKEQIIGRLSFSDIFGDSLLPQATNVWRVSAFIFVIAALLSALQLYVLFVYPLIPSAWGGGQRPNVVIHLKEHFPVDLSQQGIPISKNGLVIGPISRIFETETTIAIAPLSAQGTCIEIARDQVRAVEYLLQPRHTGFIVRVLSGLTNPTVTPSPAATLLPSTENPRLPLPTPRATGRVQSIQ